MDTGGVSSRCRWSLVTAVRSNESTPACHAVAVWRRASRLLTTHTPHSCHANTDTTIMFSLEALVLAKKAPSSLVTPFLRRWRLRAVVVTSWAFGGLHRFSLGSYLVNKHPTMFLPLGGLVNILWSQVQYRSHCRRYTLGFSSSGNFSTFTPLWSHT